jgi:hypothetical protein
MENWAEICRRVLVDGLSKRAACRQYDIPWDTLRKILDHPEPPGYRRKMLQVLRRDGLNWGPSVYRVFPYPME